MIDILIICLRAMLYFVYFVGKLSTKPRSAKETLVYAKYVLYVILLFIPTLIGVIADIIMNNTIVPLVLGGGWFEEFTFSTRLERLCVQDESDLITKELCVQIALSINRVCPTHDHIKAVLNLVLNRTSTA